MEGFFNDKNLKQYTVEQNELRALENICYSLTHLHNLLTRFVNLQISFPLQKYENFPNDTASCYENKRKQMSCLASGVVRG